MAFVCILCVMDHVNTNVCFNLKLNACFFVLFFVFLMPHSDN